VNAKSQAVIAELEDKLAERTRVHDHTESCTGDEAEEGRQNTGDTGLICGVIGNLDNG